MKKQTVFIQVPVEERLPDDGARVLTDFGLKVFRSGLFYDSPIAHTEYEVEWWLEKKEDVYPMTEDQLRELHETGYWDFNTDGKNCVQSFEEWKQINLK